MPFPEKYKGLAQTPPLDPQTALQPRVPAPAEFTPPPGLSPKYQRLTAAAAGFDPDPVKEAQWLKAQQRTHAAPPAVARAPQGQTFQEVDVPAPTQQQFMGLGIPTGAAPAPQEPQYGTATERLTTTQTRHGRPVDQPYLEATTAATEELAGIEEKIGLEKAQTEEEKADLIAQHLEKEAERRKTVDREMQQVQQGIVAREQRIDTAMREVENAKIDPRRYWNNLETSDKIAHGLVLALGGVAQILSKGKAENVGLKMLNRQMEQDIALQRETLERKKGAIKGHENMLGHLYKRLGSMEESESTLRNLLTKDLQLKLTRVEQSAAPGLVKANARKLQLALRQQVAEKMHQERVAAFSERVTTSRVQTRKVPLTRPPEATKNLDPPPDAILKKVETTDVFRKHLDQFYSAYKKLKVPGGVTAWTGEAADRVQKIQERVSESLARKLVGTGASTEMIQSFKTHIARPFSSDRDVKKRLKDLMHEADDEMASMLQIYGKKYNVLPYYKDELQRRLRQRVLYGMKYGKMQVQQPIYPGRKGKKSK
jgi:hypothetical protein